MHPYLSHHVHVSGSRLVSSVGAPPQPRRFIALAHLQKKDDHDQALVSLKSKETVDVYKSAVVIEGA